VMYALAALVPSLALSAPYWIVMTSIISVNLSLMLFNLIPIYPLDGSHVFENLFMRRIPKVCMFLRQYGRYIMIVCLVTGIFSRILGPIVGWFYGWLGAIGELVFSLLA